MLVPAPGFIGLFNGLKSLFGSRGQANDHGLGTVQRNHVPYLIPHTVSP